MPGNLKPGDHVLRIELTADTENYIQMKESSV